MKLEISRTTSVFLGYIVSHRSSQIVVIMNVKKKESCQLIVGMCPKKIQLHQIQYGRLSAIINFNMLYIRQTVPDS